MKIIFISKNKANEDNIVNGLQPLSERDSIVFFYSYKDAEDFLDNNIIKNNAEIDLIITENNIGKNKALDFFEKITKDKERTFSNFDFKFHTIPIVMIADENENSSQYKKYAFSKVLENINLEKLSNYVIHFLEVVKSWRKRILDDLENIGISWNSGKIDYSFYLTNKTPSNTDTFIISKNFKLFPRKLSYDWLQNNEKQIERAIDEYIKELKVADRLNKKRTEKKFHAIFNKYPFFIKRDNFSKHLYEPRLYRNPKEYYEPDYSLTPNFNQKTDLSILEVKLPNEGFVKMSKFHPKPYNNILQHIFQVNDYKEYLETEEYQTAIKNVLGFVPNNIDYNILVGRKTDFESNYDVFNHRIKQINSSYINWVTFDDLLEYQVKYLQRVQVLSIF